MLRSPMLASVVLAALALSACATRPYTGPVEVTRFVAPSPAGLGHGTIAITFPDDVSNLGVRQAFAAAVGAQLAQLGYTVVADGAPAAQTATVRTTRAAVAPQIVNRGSGVNVGVGGGVGGGGFGGGGFGGVGVGVDLGSLGGQREAANATTELSVRIGTAEGTALWEGRAQLSTGVKSPYSQIDAGARVLAAGLFRDFPGGNGETVNIDVKKLQGNR